MKRYWMTLLAVAALAASLFPVSGAFANTQDAYTLDTIEGYHRAADDSLVGPPHLGEDGRDGHHQSK